MRKLLFFMMLLIILSTSCSKGDDPDPNPIPPPVAELEPSILEFSIAPNDAIIPIYSDIVVKYKGDINTKKISINDIEMPNIDGTYNLGRLGITTKYTIVATNVNKTSTKEINAVVGDYTTSFMGVLTYGQWSNTSWKIWDGNILVYYNTEADLSFINKKWKWTIGTMTFSIYNADGTLWGSGNSPWDISLDGKYYLWGTGKKPFLIEKWTKDEIILSADVFYVRLNKICTERYYFNRV